MALRLHSAIECGLGTTGAPAPRIAEGGSAGATGVVIIVTGLVSLGVGVGSGSLLDLFRDRAPRLTYTTTSAEMFPGAKERTGIVLLQITNSGRREAEDVFCRITMLGATIREHQVSGLPGVDQLVRTTPGSLEVKLPFLNPQEQVSFHLLLDLSTGQLAPPSVELRAKGVVGTQDTGPEPARSTVSQALPISASVLTALATALLLLVRLRQRLGIDRLGSSHSDDQRDVLAYLLGVHGFHAEADELRRAARRMSYWGAADVVRVNMARLAVAAGKPDLATSCLAAIKAPKSEAVKARIAHDARVSALQKVK